LAYGTGCGFADQSGLTNLPSADEKYLAPKKSKPVSESRSFEVLRDLLPSSYKKAWKLVAVLELIGAKP
jgi:hypothetical protein